LRILLDTVTFVWALTSPNLLSKNALTALQKKNVLLELSSISISEIAIKRAKGKLNLSKDDVLLGMSDLKLRILPYSEKHALSLFDLPLHHNDPFDRQLVAQAMAENIPIVTCDASFKLYAHIDVIW
jgi:PIN domain nuclease of toxin-antitoxin system